MKNFFINFFRNFPICTGLLLLMITQHLVGVKDLATSLYAMSDNLFAIFFIYVGGMLFFMLFLFPRIKQEKREKTVWSVIITAVVVLTVIAKFFM